MYTRFKSQKSGMKLGLNTITNSAAVVAAAARSTRVVSVSSTSTVNSSPSSTPPISSSNSTTTVDSITSSPFLFNHTDQPIVLVDFVAPPVTTTTSSVVVDANPAEVKKSVKNKSVESDRIPFNENANVINNSNNKKSSNKKDKKSSKLTDFDQSTSDDQLADVNCIRYVKSTWEKYASEIGTQNGPLRHVDENAQYPHLNGFVAFDMEHWWAERAISCMMNDNNKPSPMANDRTDANNNNNNNIDTTDNKHHESTNLPLSSSALFQTNNKLTSISLNSSSITAGSSSSSILKAKNHHLTSFGPSSFQNLNNFQLCFS